MVSKFSKPVSGLAISSKIDEIIDDKQDTLVSGTNIKTINGSSILGSGNLTTSSAPSNMVTTDTTQDITGEKTFKGDKRIKFKQASSTNKLGFTLYNYSNSEVGGLEYNPSSNILTLNAPKTANTLLGFRYWSGNNIIVPKPSSSGDYYIPLSFKNGSTTVTTNNSGVADLSTLMPDISGKQDVSNLVTSISSSSTNTQYPSAKCVYDLVGDIESALNTINSGSST